MSSCNGETVEELDQKLAYRLKVIQSAVPSRSKSLPHVECQLWLYQTFESTGQISLYSLTKIAMALHIEDDLRNLFSSSLSQFAGGYK